MMGILLALIIGTILTVVIFIWGFVIFGLVMNVLEVVKHFKNLNRKSPGSYSSSNILFTRGTLTTLKEKA